MWPWESAWTVVLFLFLSRAKVTSTTQCMTCSILNLDWVNLLFAAKSLIFRGHEAGLLHAYWVIISCGLCFCQVSLIGFDFRCSCKVFYILDLCVLRLNKDFSFFGFLRNDCIWITTCMHASFFVRECDYFLPCQYDSGPSSIVWFAGFWILMGSAIFRFELYTKLKLHQVWRNMPCFSQDNSLSAHTAHLVFLNISESLN